MLLPEHVVHVESWPSTQAKNIFAQAIEKLHGALEGQARHESPRVQLLLSLLIALSEYSASSNSIVGLRGLGLDEGLALAQQVIDAPLINERTVGVFSYKCTAKSITVT